MVELLRECVCVCVCDEEEEDVPDNGEQIPKSVNNFILAISLALYNLSNYPCLIPSIKW